MLDDDQKTIKDWHTITRRRLHTLRLIEKACERMAKVCEKGGCAEYASPFLDAAIGARHDARLTLLASEMGKDFDDDALWSVATALPMIIANKPARKSVKKNWYRPGGTK